MGGKVSIIIEIISSLSFIISALFLSNLTGAVIGAPVNSTIYGFAFLCVAIASASLFIWMKWRKL